MGIENLEGQKAQAGREAGELLDLVIKDLEAKIKKIDARQHSQLNEIGEAVKRGEVPKLTLEDVCYQAQKQRTEATLEAHRTAAKILQDKRESQDEISHEQRARELEREITPEEWSRHFKGL